MLDKKKLVLLKFFFVNFKTCRIDLRSLIKVLFGFYNFTRYLALLRHLSYLYYAFLCINTLMLFLDLRILTHELSYKKYGRVTSKIIQNTLNLVFRTGTD